MKIKMIILVVMIVGSVAISGKLTKNTTAAHHKIFSDKLEIVAERVGS